MRAGKRSTALFFSMAMSFGAVRGAHAQCSWSTQPPGVSFGAYDVFSANTVASTTSGAISCTGNYNFSVSLSKGGSGTYAPRQMSNGANRANYNVYVDAGYTIIYGDGTGGTFVYTGTNNGGTNTYGGTVYAAAPGAQDLAQGTYNDSLVATLSYQRTSGGAWTVLPGVTVTVTMAVGAQCRADLFNLTFGNYNPFSAVALNQTSTVKVYCTKATTATLALDNGANVLGAQKRMRNGASYLNYTATLANTSPPASSSVLVPLAGGITLNGSVPQSQDAPTGNYIDTLQVQVNF